MSNVHLMDFPKESFLPAWSFFFPFISLKLVLKTDFLKSHKYSISKMGKNKFDYSYLKEKKFFNENLGKNSGTLNQALNF